MAGTRLIVHSIFVVQLICLVAASFFYASTRPFDPSSTSEPFISDQSGWKILVEDVSPVPLHDSIGGIMREYFDVVAAQVNSLLGGVEEQVHPRERRTSVFVQQMRQQISKLPLKFIKNDDKLLFALPQLKMNFHTPFIKDVEIINEIAAQFERALRDNLPKQPSSHGIILATMSDASNGRAAQEISCEEWVLPESTQTDRKNNTRKLKLPGIYLLTGCRTASSVDVPHGDAVVVRTAHTGEDISGLAQYLQTEISPILLKIAYQANTKKQTQRLERISVHLIDEDPSSHRKGDNKIHFELLSKALSSSLQSIISPIIHDLSFVYGGNVDLLDDAIFWKGAIDLSSAPSAYLSLPNDIIEVEREEAVDESQEAEEEVEEKSDRVDNEKNESVPKKFVTTEQMSKFIQSHSSPHEGLEWFLFLPSIDHSPLTLHDKKNGGIGHSIILTDSKPAGMSIVDYDLRNVDSDETRVKFINSLSHSMLHLAGYIRDLNGLRSQSMETYAAFSSTATPVNYIGGSTQRLSLSFWELESIAQSHWYPTLEQALHEMDAVMSLLNEHGSTLALPKSVAQKINTATHMLRKSISFIEEGLPAMYATSALYGALTTIDSVLADADFFELPYFAPDHFLAVFSPLVLPLIMPMIFGLIREVKRYKHLKKKQI